MGIMYLVEVILKYLQGFLFKMQKFILVLLITTYSFAKLDVVVSIQPQLEFVKKIGGDKVETTLMVLPGKSPHTYEPKPSQMKAISHAKLYLSIGVKFENVWLDRFKDQNPNLEVFDISKDINKTAMVESVHHYKEESLDPHIWVNPINVKTIAVLFISLDISKTSKFGFCALNLSNQTFSNSTPIDRYNLAWLIAFICDGFGS